MKIHGPCWLDPMLKAGESKALDELLNDYLKYYKNITGKNIAQKQKHFTYFHLSPWHNQALQLAGHVTLNCCALLLIESFSLNVILLLLHGTGCFKSFIIQVMTYAHSTRQKSIGSVFKETMQRILQTNSKAVWYVKVLGATFVSRYLPISKTSKHCNKMNRKDEKGRWKKYVIHDKKFKATFVKCKLRGETISWRKWT